MVVFPNAKINIGLYITGKRPDGFHDIESIFYPIPICDILEVVSHSSTKFSATGLEVGSINDNLCVKAVNMLKAAFPNFPDVNIHLHKNIPAGAGLGGGSSDAAFCLKLLNKKYELGLSPDQLLNYAAELGSDCAFFINNVPSFATGRGEKLIPVALDLSPYKMIVVHPGIHVSTRDAFSRLTKLSTQSDLIDKIGQPVEKWKNNISNDFEPAVFELFPEIGSLKDTLYKRGAIYASMSGSGSAVYGIFNKDHLPEINFPAHYFFRWF